MNPKTVISPRKTRKSRNKTVGCISLMSHSPSAGFAVWSFLNLFVFFREFRGQPGFLG